ncbi:hypothetical protein BGW42_007543 [Actinomortierella wolfii]|nr:hypothetical protein BGW42_007543 [Actinomortierella wolfii]
MAATLTLDMTQIKVKDQISSAYPSPVSTSPSPLLTDKNDLAVSSCPTNGDCQDFALLPHTQDQDLFTERIRYTPLPEDTIPADRNPYCECHECSLSSPFINSCWDELPKCGEAMSLDDIPSPSWADYMSSFSSSFAGFSSDSSMDTEDSFDILSYDDEPAYCPPLFDEPLRFVQIDYVRDEAGKYQPVYSLGDCGARLSRFMD